MPFMTVVRFDDDAVAFLDEFSMAGIGLTIFLLLLDIFLCSIMR